METIDYPHLLAWILYRADQGGWPARNLNRVRGWLAVKMVAELTGRTVTEVALDVIALARQTIQKKRASHG